ncbi:acetyl-CoA carboxylase biotin carboxyl carrier protein [Synechocystis sp. LKSZ1]|uniref:acetyl-CoA carboxylase biotin carboxyl carrier protein n=1 Tax=Synechocystis sp. LKSZ1 TaxID=3144951 RepID=UPI00336BBAC3
MSINFAELRELLGAISQTDITEVTLETDEFKLSVRKANSSILLETPTVVTTPLPAPPPMVSSTPAPESAPVLEVASPSPLEQKWTAITSPMVGTFYRAPAPDEPPFVEVGDSIRKEQTVCIIEAMKLMNEIEAEISGQVMEIVVANGEPVEYGQTLMWIKPA